MPESRTSTSGASMRIHPRPLTVVAALLAALTLGLLPATLTGGVSSTTVVQAASPQPRVSPSLTLAPVAATAGTTITVIGSGYDAANGVVTPTVTFAFTDAAGIRTTLPQTATDSATGGFAVMVSVPISAVAGPAVVAATDISGTASTAAFDVRPAIGATRIGATPSSGLPGSTTTVTGTGFAANQPITLTYAQNGAAIGVNAGAITTTAQGLFTTTAPISGLAPAGPATFTAQDRDNNSASTPFTVTRNGVPTVAVTPTLVAPTSSVTVTGTGFAVNRPITLTFGQGSAATIIFSGTVSTDVNGVFTATATIPTSAITGTAVITAVDAAGNSGVGAFNVRYPYNVNNGPTTLYFAEGYTGLYSTNGKATFNETLSLLNANPFTATATITYLIQGSNPVSLVRSVPPSSTLRESVNADIGPDKIAAAIVSSPSRITAERIIQRVGGNGATLDGDSSLGNPNLGQTFYFAEGYTGITFQEYLTVANPTTSDAHITVTFAPQANAITSTLSETFTVPPLGRYTRNIRGDTLGFANKSLGMVVTSDQPIMAERVLYFGDGIGSAKYGSTAKAGIQTVANQYLFAYGSAGGSGQAQQPGDQSYVTVLNPSTSPVSATIVAQFYDVNGRSLGTASLVVAPGTRQTINANAVVNNTSGVYATILTSSSPFVAEKPQYYGGSPNAGAHPGVAPSGAPTGVKSAAFPDLGLTDAAGQQEQQTVFLYNPTTAPITVTGSYYATNGGTSVAYRVAANSITTVNVDTDAGNLPRGPLGATFVVTSAGTNDQFVATAVGNTADGRSYTANQGALPAQ